MDDMISRKAAIDALEREKTYSAVYKYGYTQTDYFKQYNMGLTDGIKVLNKLPSAQPERMTNKQWVDFLSAQFDISRTSAKEMLHGMMRWKKKDNFKKLFNGGKT